VGDGKTKKKWEPSIRNKGYAWSLVQKTVPNWKKTLGGVTKNVRKTWNHKRVSEMKKKNEEGKKRETREPTRRLLGVSLLKKKIGRFPGGLKDLGWIKIS